MATDKSTAEKIADKLSPAGIVRIRSMMGEYLVYLDEVLIGQINNNELYVKVTPYGEKVLQESNKASPYPGAKPAFKIPFKKLDDAQWLIDLVQHTKDHLKK